MQDEPTGMGDMEEIDMKLAAIEHREGTESRHELIQCLTEDNPIIARAFYSAYAALVDAGFAEEQALHIVVARGWNLSEGT